jgi:ABC-type Fe3+ transport system substrate-binding protein
MKGRANPEEAKAAVAWVISRIDRVGAAAEVALRHMCRVPRSNERLAATLCMRR